MVRTSLGSETTDENGEASWTFTGTGAGSTVLVAVYDGVDSNKVTVDDYTQVTSSISLTGGGEFIQGATVSLVASCTDQHGQAMGSGVTVTFIENGASIGTASTVSGVATLNISSLSVGTHSITASVGSVVSNAVSVVVTEAPTPVASSIDLTGTKSILSYADSESSVLTATVLDSGDEPVEGVLVNIYKGSDLWYSASSDSNGEVSKTYASAGSGDIVFTAEVDGTLLTKTFAIIDYWRIYSNEFANTNFNNNVQNLNFTLPTGDFEITWEQYSDRSGSNNCYIRIGEDADNCILFGVIDGNQTLGYYIRENGTYSHQTRGSINGSVNTYQNHKVTVQNGIITYDTAELTLPSNTISLDKILSRTVWYAHHKNIKIKPL